MMVLNKPRTNFGFHSMTAINKATGLPYGIIKIVDNYTANMTREQIDLFGGSNPNAWDSALGNISTELTMTIGEFKPFLYTLAGYTVVSSEAVAASGTIGTPVNVVGSVYSTTGIASIQNSTGAIANGPAALKTGRYFIKAVSATTVDIYGSIDNEFSPGSYDVAFVNDSLKLTTAPLSITTGAQTSGPNLGFSLTGGATVAMTTDSVAYVDIIEANQGYNTYSYGDNPVPVEFEMFIATQLKANGEMVYDHFPRVVLASIPAKFATKAWATCDLNLKVLFDADYGYSFKRYDTVKDLA